MATPQDSPIEKTLEGLSEKSVSRLDTQKIARQKELGVVVFSLTPSENFALPVKNVEEILPVSGIHFIPGLPDYIPGVIIWRLEIIALLNMQRLLELPENLSKNRERLLIVRMNEMVFALQVPQVVDVITIDKDDVREMPREMENSRDFFQGYAQLTKYAITVFDLEKLVKKAMEI